MAIENCAKCGGTHYGSGLSCPFKFAPCIVCGEETPWACSDCAIDSGGKVAVHVCGKPACQRVHETALHGS